jgi:hypothetical protein
MIKKLLCPVGFHAWNLTKLSTGEELRTCEKCNKKQAWIYIEPVSGWGSDNFWKNIK